MDEQHKVWRHFALGLAVMVLVGVGISSGLVVAKVASHDAFSYDYLYTSLTMKAALVSVAVLVFLAAGYFMVRSARRLRGSAYRRIAVMIGAFFGLFFTLAPAFAADAALTWSSEHSPQVKAQQRSARAWLAHYRVAPPPGPTWGAAAPHSLAQLLLVQSDLGRSWYAATSPNPSSAPAFGPADPHAATRRAMSQLRQSHWLGTYWSLDRSIYERVSVFATEADAARYAATLAKSKQVCGCHVVNGQVSATTIRGVAVHLWHPKLHSDHQVLASFRIDKTVWAVDILTLSDQPTPSRGELSRILTLAVGKAQRQ